MHPADEAIERRDLRRLLARFDPLGVGELGLEYQPELYDSLIDPLLHRLGMGEHRFELVAFLVHELRDEHGRDPDEGVVSEFVDELQAWHTAAFHR